MTALSVAPGWDCHVHVFDGSARALPGHYQPPHRPLRDIETLAAQSGCGHLVLVQPSVYGSDNSVLLAALTQAPGRHRGIVVVEPGVGGDALQAMHALGVRGVRFNLMSPVGNPADVAGTFKALAPRLRELGWHVQWYAQPQLWGAIASLHEGSGLVAVLDHLAGWRADSPPSQAHLRPLETLADHGHWIKLSGWYRLGAQAPYAALDEAIGRVAALFGERMVWGSDWPHTAFAPGAAPAYASQWEPAARSLSAAQQCIVRCTAPPALYG
jgi:predicted TIM-barrel fold metal-dependent hydrolase